MDSSEIKNNFNNFINPFNWQCVQVDVIDGVRDPLEKDLLVDDKYPNAEIFTRELIQNSLDARNTRNNEPVYLKLEIVDFNDEPYQSTYKKIFNTDLQQLLIQSKDIEKHTYTYKALKVSDFNTTGLNGEITDIKSNWFKYFGKVGDKGQLSKQKSLGSANLGKVATWRSSIFWSVLVRTQLLNGENRFQGRSLRNTNTIDKKNPKKYNTPDVYFRRKNDKENIFISKEENNILSKLLKLNERKESGTDFLFPECREEDLQKDDLISFTLKNWFIPISQNKIIISLFGTEINSENLLEMIEKYSTKKDFLDNEMIKFAIKATQEEGDILYEMKKGIPRNKLDGRLPITNSMFSEENIKPQNILEKLYEKKLIQLKVPVKIITSKQAEFTNDYFLVSLKMREINNTYPPFGLMLRQSQMLLEEKDFWRSARGVNGLMILVSTKSDTLSTLLTYFEAPTHLKFVEKFFKGKEQFEIGNSCFLLYLFRNTSNKFLDYLLSSDEIEDPNKYSKFFPEMKLDDNDLGSDTDNSDDDDDDDDDPDDPDDPDKRKIKIKKSGYQDIARMFGEGDTVKIKSVLEDEQLIGQKLKMIFGLNGQKGYNVFGNKRNRITRYDLDLASVATFEEYNGCEIDVSTIEWNSFEISVTKEKFDIKISGLHPYSYVLDCVKLGGENE